MLKPKKLTKKQIEREEFAKERRAEREKTELGCIQNLIREFAIPGSMYDGVSEYVILSESALVKQIFSEWKALKQSSDAVAAKKEIERWQDRVRILEHKLNEIRRIVK